MPKGEFTRPKGTLRGTLSDPSGRANEMTRRAAASGDPRQYTSFKRDPADFEREMRMRERGTGTAQNEGYVKGSGMSMAKEPIDPSNPLNTAAPERKARALRRKRGPFILSRD